MAHQPAAPRARPGELLVHPIPVLAVAVLVVNDHILKSVAPSLLTGKLSDVAGLLFFPLLLVSIVELAAVALGRTPPDRRRQVICSIITTGLVFFLVKATVAGSSTLGWSVGVAQWLAGAGFVRGEAPQPVAVATDAGDLIALSALVVAWFVARRHQAVTLPGVTSELVDGRRAPSRTVTLMLVVASLATIASGNANRGQQAMVTWEEPIHLDDATTAATRHLSYDVDMKGNDVQSITLSPEIHPSTVWGLAKPGMTLTVLPDESAVGAMVLPAVPADGMTARDLTKACVPSCHGGVTLIVRLTGPAPDGVDLTLYAAIYALTDAESPKFEPTLALRNDADLGFEGTPASQVSKTQGTFHVTTTKPKAKQWLEVRINAAALKAPLDYPLVATIETYLQTTDEERFAMPAGMITIGATNVQLATGLPYASIDVLSMCKVGRTCVVPVRVEADYSENLTVVDPSSIQHAGSADLVWRIRVRLEAFDRRKFPTDAVSITKQ